MKDHNKITKPVHFVHVMGAKEDCFALSFAGFNEIQNGLSRSNVEPGGRFIEYDDFGVVNKCAGNRNFLLHTGRQ
ncbi:hypothetical protein ES703_76708 [subsurface metagenome]